MLPHRRQPTRLPRPWDSPGKNTGVGCRFLLQCIKVKSESEVAQSCLTLSDRDPMDCSLLHPWDFPGKSTGVGCHCLLPKSLQSCPTLCDPMGYSLPGSSVREIFPSKNIGVGCHFLLQRIFLIQELNPSLLCSCRGMCVLYH